MKQKFVEYRTPAGGFRSLRDIRLEVAAAAIESCGDIRSAARALRVGKSTVYRWLDKDTLARFDQERDPSSGRFA